jgi:hypothetical protein
MGWDSILACPMRDLERHVFPVDILHISHFHRPHGPQLSWFLERLNRSTAIEGFPGPELRWRRWEDGPRDREIWLTRRGGVP